MTKVFLEWVNMMYEEGRDAWVSLEFNGNNFQEISLKNAQALGACRAYLSILEIDFLQLNEADE